MKDIIFNNLIDVDLFFNSMKMIDGGREGVCYKKGNISYKKYNDLYKCLYSNDVAIYRLLRFRELIVDNVYFIRALIYCNDQVVGSICDYASGISCNNIKLHQRRIDKLVKALSILKMNVYELSELGIYIDDNFLGNILYDNKTFKLIDMGGSFHSSDIFDDFLDRNEMDKDDVSVIYRRKMVMIMKILFVNITDKYYINDNFIYAFLYDINSPYKDYLVDSDLLMNPDDTIIGIKDTLQEYIGYEIVNFSQCRKDLLKIRKKNNAS